MNGDRRNDDFALRQRLAEVALGRTPPDLVFRNASVVNVFTGGVESAHVALSGGRIAGVGDYRGPNEMDLAGRFLAPGFVDAHVHVESSHLTPSEYARAVVPHGTVSIVADPHELANVGGVEAVRWFVAAAASPLRVHTMVPSCVPASPFETPGQVLGADDVEALQAVPGISGLAEVMNVPGVLAGDSDLLAKLAAFEGEVIDGHAPGVLGSDLCAYLDYGIGSDHEATSAAELREKVARGMYVGLRQGSSAQNLRCLLAGVDAATARRCFLVTDDRSAADLAELGHIDDCLRICVAEGMDPVQAITLATLNPAEYLREKERGAVAPGYWADLVVLEDLNDFRVLAVFIAGVEMAREGIPLWTSEPVTPPSHLLHSMHVAPLGPEAFGIQGTGNAVRVIEAAPGQLFTGSSVWPTVDRQFPEPTSGIARLAVVERHHDSGRVGVGLVRGLGLRAGAIASTTSHDAHHLIVCGTNEYDMVVAANHVISLGGGFAVALESDVLAAVPMPIGGLITTQSFEDTVAAQRRLRAVLAPLVIGSHDPFDTLQFLALTVIPELKLSDRGLVEVTSARRVELFASAGA